MTPANRARRENAKRSTGPKTPQGKRRSAQNARQHGLNIPLHFDASQRPRIEALAQLIAPGELNEARAKLALRIAEATLELCRIQILRHRLLSEPVAMPLAPMSDFFQPLKDAETHQEILAAVTSVSEAWAQQPRGWLDLTKPEQLLHHFETLRILERYDRRTLSRRKFLIREYDALGREKERG